MKDSTIYRTTRNAASGMYYKRMSANQIRRTLTTWRRRYLEGRITGQEMCQLMAYRDHPDWLFWRCCVRIRGEAGLRESSTVVVLPPSTRFRAVKRKPKPVKG